MIKAKRRPFGTPLDALKQVISGGAGIRTPVRNTIHYSVYVRSLPRKVFSRYPTDMLRLNKVSTASRVRRNHPAPLSRICDAWPARQERSKPDRCSNRENAGYAARAKLSLAVVKLPSVFYEEPGPSARGHSFTYPVETSRPRK
jgi:hypothetical protein